MRPEHMHTFDEWIEPTADEIARFARQRIEFLAPLDRTASEEELRLWAGNTVTKSGLGPDKAFAVFRDILEPNTMSQDSPSIFAYVPCAPTRAASLFDMVVGASAMLGATWFEGSGAVYAENEAMRWLCEIIGYPKTSNGVFVSGGTIANLSGLVVARHQAMKGRNAPARWRIAVTEQTHSSVAIAARVMDVDLVDIPVDDRQRMTGEALQAVLDADEDRSIFAVVLTGGTTNAGIVDSIDTVASVTQASGVWLHVDAAYGGAALCVPEVRQSLFRGIELADSVVIDPHKWLFAPFDCGAIIYRQPELAREALMQHAPYLEAANDRSDEWNPEEYAIHLTRRARGLPFWYSLATYGTEAYTAAVRHTIEVSEAFGQMVEECDYTSLVRPVTLSVVLIDRHNWDLDTYQRWSDWALAENLCFAVPSSWQEKPCLRLCVINPRTTLEVLERILDSLKADPPM